MGEAFVELAGEAVNHLTNDRYWDKGWDHFRRVRGKSPLTGQEDPRSARVAGPENNLRSERGSRNPGRHRNTLPSPERVRERDDEERETVYISERGRNGPSGGRRDDSLERQSQASERVTKAYENEADDPVRPVDPKLDRVRTRDRAVAAGGAAAAMSNLNAPSGYAQGRSRSQQPASRGYYDDDGSDYDEREGRRHRTSGRGYDDDRDYPYEREVVETERYRGPARPAEARRMESYGSRAYDKADGPYATGAVAQYRRSQNDLTQVSRRNQSRGRNNRDSYDDDRDRGRDYSYSRSRSRSRSHSKEGWRGKLEESFDTTPQGLGVGLVGAVIGGLAGRQFGQKHKNRDILMGAVIGGLGANAAEEQWKRRKERKDDGLEGKEEKWEQKYGRSRSTGR